MATGAYFNALGYKLYLKIGTTASTAPTSGASMTEVFSLSNAGITSQSDTQDVLDYGSTLGWKASVVTGQSYSIPCQLNIDLRDPAYKLLKEAARDSAAGKTVEWYRESPEMSSTGDPEKHAGVAQVTDFSEDIQAGNIAQVSFTLNGYGAYTWTAETDA